ncbi:MAG: helix-turn-helix transcriptional regulator [Oscillospiraceae bacterium]|nr:helix-turn-helix transcriptional regulator [Oscillospiraceae bacterium]
MDDYKKGMGQRIKSCRKYQRITQEEMAEMLGISVKHFSEVERGLTGLSVDNLIKLSSILGQSLDYLIKGETVKNPYESLLYNLQEMPVEKQKDMVELIRTGIRLAKTDTQVEHQV